VKISYAAPTSLGPTSQEEAQVLWREGQAAAESSKHQDAVNYLQRLVDRYPGTPGYLKAKYFLGRSYLELDQPKKALIPLKDFISGNGLNLDSAKARTLLGQTYLAVGRFHEAYLTSLELDQIENKIALTSDIILESLLVKAQALLGLKHDSRAVSALEAAEKKLTDKNSPQIRGQTYNLKLKLKILHCSQFPGPSPLDEGQIRDQLDRRGTCILEALLLFQKVLATGDLRTAGIATTQINQAYTSYYQSCKTPKITPRTATPLEQKRFQAELADRLTQDFKKKSNLSIEFLSSWKAQLPLSAVGAITQVSKNLKDLTSQPL
jgi:tetratricopeptide (TPR) repeat protein